MNNKDYVDIILPNFNSSKYIEKTLKSIFVQSYKKWKLITPSKNEIIIIA